jgi:hypothetical protein
MYSLDRALARSTLVSCFTIRQYTCKTCKHLRGGYMGVPIDARKGGTYTCQIFFFFNLKAYIWCPRLIWMFERLHVSSFYFICFGEAYDDFIVLSTTRSSCEEKDSHQVYYKSIYVYGNIIPLMMCKVNSNLSIFKLLILGHFFLNIFSLSLTKHDCMNTHMD